MVLLLHDPEVRLRNDRRSAKGCEYGYSRDIRLASGVWGGGLTPLTVGSWKVLMECSILEFSGRGRIDDLNPFLYPTWEATPSS
jgi:hypothetical protein